MSAHTAKPTLTCQICGRQRNAEHILLKTAGHLQTRCCADSPRCCIQAGIRMGLKLQAAEAHP